jgi:hypothetical protein
VLFDGAPKLYARQRDIGELARMRCPVARLAQRNTQAQSSDTSPTSAEMPDTGQQSTMGSNRAGLTGTSSTKETSPVGVPNFTPQDYGVMLVLLAAFVILVRSLFGRRGD